MSATVTWHCACGAAGCTCVRAVIGPVVCAECAAGAHRIVRPL